MLLVLFYFFVPGPRSILTWGTISAVTMETQKYRGATLLTLPSSSRTALFPNVLPPDKDQLGTRRNCQTRLRQDSWQNVHILHVFSANPLKHFFFVGYFCAVIRHFAHLSLTFYTSTKSWRGYISLQFVSVCVSVYLLAC